MTGASAAPDRCAQLLKLLADQTRLAVVRQLIAGPKLVADINASLQLEQSHLSHHLKILREAGLVVSERRGKAMRYALAAEFRGTTAGSAIDLGCCLISFTS